MKKIILMMTLFLLSFSYGFADKVFNVSADNIYFKEKIIKNTTTTSRFTVKNLKIDPFFDWPQGTESYFKFNDKPSASSITGGFIEFFSPLEITSSVNVISKDGKVYFKDINGNKRDILINFSGTCRFRWAVSSLPRSIILGRIINEKAGGITAERDVVLFFNGIKVYQALTLTVDQHMNLGKGMAGETFNTNGGTTKGTAAEISLTGSENEKVKITIPKTTEIKNGKNSLKVNLNFREKATNGTNSNEWELEKTFPDSGEIKNITIDGNMQTTKETPTGKYKGTFKVRAEYID